MTDFTALKVAQSLLNMTSLRMFTYYEERIPQDLPVILVSNHRSFLDAAILIRALNKPLRIVCHHYMGKTPILGQIVKRLGCFSLAEPQHRQRQFVTEATDLLTTGQWVGVFPEGTHPMVEKTSPQQVGKFQRGFAHLAWHTSVPKYVLPVAIASKSETVYATFPIRWLRWFDRSEPLFERRGLHPIVFYHRVNVLIGHPYLITEQEQQNYHGKQAKIMATDLTNYCREQIIDLLTVGSPQ